MIDQASGINASSIKSRQLESRQVQFNAMGHDLVTTFRVTSSVLQAVVSCQISYR
jgi:hypothetical protein